MVDEETLHVIIGVDEPGRSVVLSLPEQPVHLFPLEEKHRRRQDILCTVGDFVGGLVSSRVQSGL